MIVSRTPFRISFFGGGTDYPAWYRDHGGAVIAATMDKYCYISCRYLPPFFDYKHRIVYSQVEYVKEIDEIKHPAVKGVLKHLGIKEGLEIHHDGDLPARSGLGSSSSFTVGLIHAIKALEGKLIAKRDLAVQAIHVEQEVIRETVGCQDQILASYGGFVKIEFNPDDSFSVTPMILDKEKIRELQDHCMLFFTGFSRYASEIARESVKNIGDRHHELKTMRNMVDEAISILQSKTTRIDEFGKLLHESWQCKRRLSDKVSTPEIDQIYQNGLEGGALGGKILGAGGGGFILFFVRPAHRKKVLEKLKKLVHVSFRFDFTGSKIVIYEPNNFE